MPHQAQGSGTARDSITQNTRKAQKETDIGAKFVFQLYVSRRWLGLGLGLGLHF